MSRYLIASYACLIATVLLLPANAFSQSSLSVGVAETDITPTLGDQPVYIAGYGQNRPATGVHDPLMARALVLSDGETTIAMAAVDLVGLQYEAVQQIRDQLPEVDYVMVASTHNHEGPDVLGLWGPSPFRSGVDPAYIAFVVQRTVDAIKRAAADLVPVKASYGTARDDSLLRDSRLPHVPDGIIRVVQFNRVDNGKPHAVMVDWSCHPEAMGPRNQLLTADFPYATVALLKERLNCPIVYFTSACGGLMAPPRGTIRDQNGNELREGDFEYCRVYGEAVGHLALEALEASASVNMTPIQYAAKPISIPMENRVYQLGKIVGLLDRNAWVWSGDYNQRGDKISAQHAGKLTALETEVAYLRCGEFSIVGMPGEIYPELVYGEYQEPADPNADFPDAPLEKPIVDLVPDAKFMLIGLANDEIGYVIPLRQWDEQSPFAYGKEKGQYGESNSVGKQAAPILMQALEDRIGEIVPAR